MYSAAKVPANPSLLNYNFMIQNYTVSPESHKDVELLLVNTANCLTLFEFGPLFLLPLQGFGLPEAKTRGGTLGFPARIHTRTKNIC